MRSKRFSAITFVVILSLLLSVVGLSPAPLARAQSARTPDAPPVMPPPQHTFEGQFRAAPGTDTQTPDTSGDVGMTVYIQAVNEAVAIYSKTGMPIVGSTPFETFWGNAGTGTACDGGDSFHHGQPSVLYDHMAQRWVVMDVAYENADTGPYYFCIAVTNATAGEAPLSFTDADWNYFTLRTSDNVNGPHFYPDQPRIGLWPDGYYIAADMYDMYNNGLNRTPQGAKVWAVNRDDLVNYQAPNPPEFRVKAFHMDEGLGYHGLLPSNLKGDPPPTGTPNFFVAVAPAHNFYIWSFYVDWVLGTASFAFNPVTLSMDTPFSKTPGYLVPQAGNAEMLDILGDRLNSVMYRVVDEVGTLFASHTVANPEGGTDLRWYEIREPETAPYFYQQGIHHPDSSFRWNSSIAVDGEGNVAVGYSISDSGRYPSIYYAGRLASDPLHQLYRAETVMHAGTWFQDIDPDIYGPWGHKSAMTVDPVDDCVFWYTNQYYDSANSAQYLAAASGLQWRTRIGWFRFPSCKQGTTARVSLHTNGAQGDLSSGEPLEAYSVSTSENGRWVAFTSEATNLVDDDTNGRRDVFVRDRDVDMDGIYDEPGQVKTVRLSLSTSGMQANGHSWEVSISPDGRYVAFSSDASILVSGDTNGTRDVFVRDRDVDMDGIFDESGQVSTFRVSVNDAGEQGNGQSDQPSIDVAYDGGSYPYLYVAFRSYATNLVIDDNNGVSDIFLYFDNPYGFWTERVSVANNEAEANGPSYTPSIAASISIWFFGPIYVYDVAFVSQATNLVSGDSNGVSDVFVRDNNGDTLRVSLRDNDQQANGESYHPAISGDGNRVAFVSRATNIPGLSAPPDTNGVADVFVRNRVLGRTTRVSLSFLSNQANADSYHPSISADGRFIAFASDASTLDLVTEYNGVRDIFLHDRKTGLTKRISNGYNGEADGMSVAPAISGDGRHVAYPSFATNLVTNDTNNKWDVFAHDRQGIIPTFLEVASNVPGYPGKKVSVPVKFTSHGQSIDTTTFSIDFDQDCLTFNPADGNGDGKLDAVHFSLPAGFDGSASYSASDPDGELDITIKYTTPGAALVDGTILTLDFTVNTACQTAPDTSRSARVGFSNDPPASFGKMGASIRGKTADGFVEIFSGLLGDCNADGKVDAGDVSALVLEIFDGDGTSPANTPHGTFKGNPVGCNPNQDIVVDAGDISCDILIIFGGTCGESSTYTSLSTYQTAGDTPLVKPVLELGGPSGRPGDQIVLPVSLNSNGKPISTMTFSIDIDPALLELDPADGDGDGIPDAIRFDLPADFQVSASYDPADLDGELDFAIFDLAAPQAVLPDDELVTIQFTLVSTPTAVDTPAAFASDPRVSFGSATGTSIPGKVLDARKTHRVYFPMLRR